MCAALGNYLVKYRIVKAFLHNIAAYPSGSLVELNTGEIGVVVDTPKGYSLFPRLRLLFDKYHRPLDEARELSLLEQRGVFVVKVLAERESKQLVASWLSR